MMFTWIGQAGSPHHNLILAGWKPASQFDFMQKDITWIYRMDRIFFYHVHPAYLC
jgi:hypothetical protein